MTKTNLFIRYYYKSPCRFCTKDNGRSVSCKDNCEEYEKFIESLEKKDSDNAET